MAHTHVRARARTHTHTQEQRDTHRNRVITERESVWRRQTHRQTHTHTHLQVGVVRSVTECKSFRRQVYVRLSSTLRMSEDYGTRKPRCDTEHNLCIKYMILQLRLVVLLTRGQWCACVCVYERERERVLKLWYYMMLLLDQITIHTGIESFTAVDTAGG